MNHISPQVKSIIKEWVEFNKAKYGPDWKKIVSEQMTADLMKDPVMEKLVEGLKNGKA